MQQIRRVCVFCGSSDGEAPVYREAASELGAALASAEFGIVFGGGRIGLMGRLADAALAAGGAVIGVIPARLRDRELAHEGVSELVIVETMHERKRAMAERADAFVILPGGIGTLDEFFEALSWRQLGFHAKPIFILDVAQYWAPLRHLLDHLVGAGFTPAAIGAFIEVVPSIPALLRALREPR